MNQTNGDVTRSLMLDGNGMAGTLTEIFSAEMTASPTECAACGKDSAIGELLAFTRAPGVVLRCPACEAAMVRIVRTERFTYLDARGAVYLRIAR